MATGKRVRGATYLHRFALTELAATERERVDTAARMTGSTWNVVRLSRDEIALLEYGDFDEDPFPALRASTLVRADGRVISRDYSARQNPPILHRKELLVGSDHANRSSWAAATTRLVQAGAFANPHQIGTRLSWRRRLDELSIDEFGMARS